MNSLIFSSLRFSFASRSIPVLNLAPYLSNSGDRRETAQQLRKICKQTGFFCIKNHGVPQELQASILSNMKQFFDLPLYEKKAIDIHKSGIAWKGYFEFAEEFTGLKRDLIEGILFRREPDENHPSVKRRLPFYGPNPFHPNMPELKRDALLWLKEMERVGGMVSEVVAESLGLDRYFFKNGMCRDHLGTLGLLHYPPINYNQDDWGISEHTDHGFLTILMFDQPRLQVENVDREWISVNPIPDTFVVNIGDVLEVITKGLYKSTLHRARNYTKVSRYSAAYFYDVDWYTELKPLDIRISPEQQSIIDRVKQIERWDKAKLHELKGIFGHYYRKKTIAEFPTLREQLEKNNA